MNKYGRRCGRERVVSKSSFRLDTVMSFTARHFASPDGNGAWDSVFLLADVDTSLAVGCEFLVVLAELA